MRDSLADHSVNIKKQSSWQSEYAKPVSAVVRKVNVHVSEVLCANYCKKNLTV